MRQWLADLVRSGALAVGPCITSQLVSVPFTEGFEVRNTIGFLFWFLEQPVHGPGGHHAGRLQSRRRLTAACYLAVFPPLPSLASSRSRSPFLLSV